MQKKTSYISDDIVDLFMDFTNAGTKEDNIEVELLGFNLSYLDYALDQHSHIQITHRRSI